MAQGFEKWHFPHCVGVVDGKHISIQQPKRDPSYYKYKGSHTIVVMAAVNANGEFLFVDVGTHGRVRGGLSDNSALFTQVEGGTLGLPADEPLPGSHRTLPYVFVGNDAFPLRRYFMKAYPAAFKDDQQCIFSYRLSRAHRIAENAFGIMTDKFSRLKNTINLEPSKVEKIILACTALHNYLLRDYEAEYAPAGTMDSEDLEKRTLELGKWRTDTSLVPLASIRRCIIDEEAEKVRREFTEYFSGEGAVPWQYHMCGMEEQR